MAFNDINETKLILSIHSTKQQFLSDLLKNTENPKCQSMNSTPPYFKPFCYILARAKLKENAKR